MYVCVNMNNFILIHIHIYVVSICRNIPFAPRFIFRFPYCLHGFTYMFVWISIVSALIYIHICVVSILFAWIYMHVCMSFDRFYIDVCTDSFPYLLHGFTCVFVWISIVFTLIHICVCLYEYQYSLHWTHICVVSIFHAWI